MDRLKYMHNYTVSFFGNCRVEQRSPTIYVGGGQEFLSEIGLFRRLPGTDLFATRVKSGSTIELGENVELRSIVRKGDGKSQFHCTLKLWYGTDQN